MATTGIYSPSLIRNKVGDGLLLLCTKVRVTKHMAHVVLDSVEVSSRNTAVNIRKAEGIEYRAILLALARLETL